MKLLRLIIPCVLVAVFIGIYVWNSQIDVREQKREEIRIDNQVRNTENQSFLDNGEQLGAENIRKFIEDETIAVLPTATHSYYRRAIKGNMHPITFYGRVVDQYGEPVAGANLKMGSGGSFIAGGKHWHQKTDSQGLFRVEVEGSSLLIRDISHPNAEFKRPLYKNGQLTS